MHHYRNVFLLLIGLLWICAASGARAQEVTEFTVPSADAWPMNIAAGPDGNLWLTEWSRHVIARITPEGVIKEFPLPPAGNCPLAPLDITAGPDGNLWFTTSTCVYYHDGPQQTTPLIGRITPAGVVTTFPVPAPPQGIGAGPDGALWFGERTAAKIGRITTSGAVTEFPTGMDGTVAAIAAGPDGALWFTQIENDRVGRITTDGVVREITRAATVTGTTARPIVAGPDGNLWFLERGYGTIRRVTTAGVMTEFTVVGTDGCLRGITVGPDGALWFTEGDDATHNRIGRITTDGAITHFNLPGNGFDLCGNAAAIAAGSDGALWFVEERANRIGRLSIDRREGKLPTPSP